MYYVVQPGDTLHYIAIMYNTTVSNLMNLNSQISDPDEIYPGERIQVSSGDHWGRSRRYDSWNKKSWHQKASTSWSGRHHYYNR